MSVNAIGRVLKSLETKGVTPLVKEFQNGTAVSFARKGKNFTQIYDKKGQLLKFKIGSSTTDQFVTKGEFFSSAGGISFKSITKRGDLLEDTVKVEVFNRDGVKHASIDKADLQGWKESVHVDSSLGRNGVRKLNPREDSPNYRDIERTDIDLYPIESDNLHSDLSLNSLTIDDVVTGTNELEKESDKFLNDAFLYSASAVGLLGAGGFVWSQADKNKKPQS